MGSKIPFLITIDTEGDNLWSKPEVITTNNTKQLFRFQELCIKYGLKPTYLTNYEMAMDTEFVKFGKKYLNRKQCEIGMHLHGWNSPPIVPLTTEDNQRQPYLIEYCDEIMEEKIVIMTRLLEERFETKATSHRSGRWAMNETYMKLLEKYGYKVDCSVTPGVSWAKMPGGNPAFGGSDYRLFPSGAYHPSSENIGMKGDMKILEVPVTIIKKPRYGIGLLASLEKSFFFRNLFISKLLVKNSWIRPGPDNLEDMMDTAEICKRNDHGYIEFMLHSSEMTQGLNPTFLSEESIDKLFEDMEKLFQYVSAFSYGETLTDFHPGI